MKVVMFLLFLAQGLYAQTPESEIIAVLEKQQIAWNKADIEGFMDGYWKSDSLRFIGKKGITYGWKPVLENYKKSYSTKDLMGTLSFTSLDLTVLDLDAAFVTGNWRISYKEKEEIGGWFSLLFRKIEGVWVIVADHTS
jgi:ketosteroid isomerase-like protein